MKKLKVKPGQLPEWAKYAAKDKDKKIHIYKDEPSIGITFNDEFLCVGPYQQISDLKIKGPWAKSLRKIKIVDDDFDKIYKKCCKKVAREIVRILTEDE